MLTDAQVANRYAGGKTRLGEAHGHRQYYQNDLYNK